MTYRAHGTARQSPGEVSASSSTFVDVLTLTHLAADQVPGASYVLFFGGDFQIASTTVDYRGRLLKDGTQHLLWNNESQESSSPIDWDPQAGFVFYTAHPTTPVDIVWKIQVANESGASVAKARNSNLSWLALTADDKWDTDTARVTTTSNTFQNTGASVSFTPASTRDYIALGFALVDGQETESVISDGTNVSDDMGCTAKDTSNRTCQMNIWPRASQSGAKTFTLQYKSTTGGMSGCSEMRILLLDCTGFDNVYSTVLGSSSDGTQTSYQTGPSQTFTPAANDHLTLAAWRTSANSNSISNYGQFVDGGTVVCEGVREMAAVDGEWPRQAHRIEAYAASSRTQSIQRKSETTGVTTRLREGAAIVTFDLGVAATGVTIDVPAASVTVAALAPSVAAGVAASIPAAAIAMAGQAPVVAAGASVALPAASIALQGLAPTVLTGASIAVPAAAVSVADLAPVISAGVALDIPAAAIAVAAMAPDLGSGAAVAVPAADINVQALAPTISIGTLVAPPAAAIAVQAFAPVVLTGASVAVPAAQITIAVLAPSVVQGVRVDVPAAPVTVAALAPSVGTGAVVDVPLAAIAVGGSAPQISAGASIAVPAAQITIAGLAPSVAQGALVDVPAAPVTIAAVAPSIAAGVALAIPAASVVVIGLPPVIQTGVALLPPPANVNVAGLAPSVSAGASIAVPAAQIMIAAMVPAIAAGASINAPVLTIQTVAFPPSLPTVGANLFVPAAAISIIGLAPDLVGFIGEGDPQRIRVDAIAARDLVIDAIAVQTVTVKAQAVAAVEIHATLKRKVP